MDWSQIINSIERYNSFVIVSHVGLEGDAVGSQIALSGFLRNLGKTTILINDDPVPPSLRFMLNGDTILQPGDKEASLAIERCDAAFIVDVSNWQHTGKTGELIKSSGKPVLCIDHHQSDNPLGDVLVIDSTACSAGILIYDLIQTYRRDLLDKPIARAIYTAILTDTGNFRFSNTNPAAFRVAAQLLECGIDHSKICRAVYENNPWARFRLMHKCLGTLTDELDGKIAWIKITRDMLKKTGATYGDSEGFVDILRTISGVEVSILFREIEDNKTKATFRSKEYVDVQKLASVFGGGGHARASGATVLCPMDEAIAKVLEQTKKCFSNDRT